MEQGDSLHLPRTAGSELVPAAQHLSPLLPYERQLIDTLGISEQEYREFAAEVAHRGLTRPAGYAHIPDIRCDPISIIVSLVIGIALTAVSALLAPKPKTPEEIKQKTLSNQRGRTRFNDNTGFDSTPQLAQLGSRVPLVFGRYETYAGDLPPDEEVDVGESGASSGGIVVEPLLVWSRMLSNGSFQSLKVIAVIGQAGIDTPPSLQGVMLGGQPIMNFYKTSYAFFWSSIYGDNRLDLSKLIGGDASPDGHFLVPTMTSDNGPGFSAVYSPANAASFGVYNSIPNGGHFRLNWRVISYPEEMKRDSGGQRATMERRKIAGREADSHGDNTVGGGMPGIGRWYSTRMGITAINGHGGHYPHVTEVKKGDIVTYTINQGKFTEDTCEIEKDADVSCDDIQNISQSTRERADDILKVGEVFMCNRTLMRVIKRPSEPWRPKEASVYKLEVIGFTGGNREIATCGTRAITDYILSEGNYVNPDWAKGTHWYPLHKVDIAQVRNTRPVEVTELGLSSNVWTRFSGLCNFSSVPSPEKLIKLDGDNVNVTSGQIDKYGVRSSFFMLAVKSVQRPQGVDATGEDNALDDYLFDGFDFFNDILFCVRNNRPTESFSYIRLRHPEKGEFEFRLVPKDACNILRYEAYQGQTIYVLDAGGPERSLDQETVYGTFNLKFNAHLRVGDELFDLPELSTRKNQNYYTMVCKVTSLAVIGTVGPTGINSQGGGWGQAYWETILGPLRDPSNPDTGTNKAEFGERRTRSFSFVSHQVTFNCTVTAVCADHRGDEAFYRENGTYKRWEQIQVTVVSTAGKEVTEAAFYDDTRAIGTSWYASYWNRTGSVTNRFQATGVTCRQEVVTGIGPREFEDNAAVKEISVYQEISRSCDDGPEHRIAYMNESLDCPSVPNYADLTMVGVKLRTLNQVQSFQQLQIYLKDGMSVTRLEDGVYGPTNNFADVAYWLLTQPRQSIGDQLGNRLVDRQSFVETAKFQRQTRLRFDGAIVDQVNLRSYLTQTAPLFLCNLIIKNGKFALVPGIPVQSNGEIDPGPVRIQQMFTDGNIIDGSFELSYLDQVDRQDFRAVVSYREMKPNALANTQSMMVKWAGEQGIPPPQEDIDMTQFCTRRGHAFIAARYLMSLRRRVDHIIKFQTVVYGLSLAPGDYIRVETSISPYEAANNVVVRSDLSLLTGNLPEDGTYEANVYREGSQEVVTEQITIKDGRATDPTLANALLNIPHVSIRRGVYMVDKIDMTEEGLVEIAASHFPVYADGRSVIVDDILHANRYIKFEVIE